MRLGLLPLFWLATACDPFDRQARTIVFEAPVPHVMLPGDSVAALAGQFGVSEADVRAWNGLEKREPRVGEVVRVWRPPRSEPSLALVLRMDHGETPGPRPRVADAGRARSRPRVAPARTASVGLGLADLRSWMMTPDTAARPMIREPVELDVEATSVSGSGLLGVAHLETGDLDELDVKGLTGRRGAVATTSLSSRGNALAAHGAAESMGQVAALRALGAPMPGQNFVPTGAVRPVSLATPAAKRCLTTSTHVALGDEDMAGSRGLTATQVRASLAPFAKYTSACIPTGSQGSWSASFGVTIGCDGRVSSSWTVQDGGLPDSVTSCIESTLRHAAFPAHDMPAGVDVTWPITYRK